MPKFVRRIGGADLNTNPYYNDPKYVGNGGYFKGNKSYQCVNYAIGRTCEIAEERATYFGTDTTPPKPMFNRKGYGNALSWIADTKWEHTTDYNEARLGDVIVYGASWGMGYGHVRIIEAIENDYFICSGGNEDGKGSCKFSISVPKNQKGIIGFIHNPYITEEKTKDYKKLYLEAQKKLDRIKEIINE